MARQYEQPTLLTIPPEMRLLIYANALISPEPVDLSTGYLHRAENAHRDPIIQAFYGLSLACKQTHHEIGETFFARNTFSFIANRPLSTIPDRYVQQMRNIVLYRTLIGKTFMLKIYRYRNGDVETEVEVADCNDLSTKDESSKSPSAVERTILLRLTNGAGFVADMLRKATEDKEGFGIRHMNIIVKKMNYQWIIAM